MNFEENSKEIQFEVDDAGWKPRTKISQDHLNILKDYFNENPSPDHEELNKIADEIGNIIFLGNYIFSRFF